MRRAGSGGEATEALIRKTAINLIAEHGFEAMTVRQLAKAIGLQQASLYNHFSNKQTLLFELLESVIHDLLDAFSERVLPLQTPTEQLDMFVTLHIDFHTKRKNEVFLATTELRSLEGRNLTRIITLRNRYEKYVIDILRRGVQDGTFSVQNVRLTAYALIAMLTGVSTWYKPGGKVSQADLIANYQSFARRMVGAPE